MRSVPEATAWRLIAVLSVISAGAYVGNEAARYFWDLSAYVAALDTDYPYRFEDPYPFLYPPLALDLFTLARSHLFELMSIAQVAAVALLLKAFAKLEMERRFEWLLAVVAMGGLGVVSLLSGNVGVLMNLTLLSVVIQAAVGNSTAFQVLPVVIGLGALIKPQFGVYLGLLLFLERSRLAAVVKAAAVGVVVFAIHGIDAVLRPAHWNEYVQAVVKRTVVEKDFAWGPAGFIKHFSDTAGAGTAAYLAGFAIVGALAFAAWRRSERPHALPRVAMVSLAFLVLTFANPRMPLYDVFAAGLALVVCCGLANRPATMAWVMAVALAVNLIPWTIANFARTPAAFPWWLQSLQIVHIFGLGSLLIALARVGFRPAAAG